MERYGIHFIHASDEFYLLAGRDLPAEETYDGYLQYENGVGMLTLFIEEARDAISELKPSGREAEVSIATGRLAGSAMRMICSDIEQKLPGMKIHVYEIRNDFFGEKITVSGLITGQDIIAQLKGRKLGSRLLLPRNMFRSGEETFLDDLTREDVERELGVCVMINDCSGYDFVNGVTDE